jgi:hypothetical protein
MTKVEAHFSDVRNLKAESDFFVASKLFLLLAEIKGKLPLAVLLVFESCLLAE